MDDHDLERLLADDPALRRCLNPQTLDDVLCCYGDEHCSCEETSVKVVPVAQDPRLLAIARKLEGAHETLRKANRLVAEPVIDAAIESGRIPVQSRERFLELAEADPDGVKVTVGSFASDPRQAQANAARSSDLDEAYKAYAAAVGIAREPR